jgi:hypothetical protein
MVTPPHPKVLRAPENLSRQTADSLESLPCVAEFNALVSANDAGVLILESLEHAEERHAEILAELVFDETSSDSIFLNSDGDGRSGHKLLGPEVKDVSCLSGTALNRSAGRTCDAAVRAPIFYAAETQHTFLRIATVAVVLMLALLAMGR